MGEIETFLKLFDQCKFEEALEYNKKFITENPESPHYHFNHAMVLSELNRFSEAAIYFEKAKNLKPDCPVLHYFLSDILLRLGKFRQGFAEKEWRFTLPLPDSHMPNPVVFTLLPKVREMYEQPDWDGKTSLEGKKLAIFNEAGFGDCIQNLRYLKRIQDTGAHVILEVKSELYRICKNVAGIDELTKRDKQDKMPAWFSTFTNMGKKTINLPPHDYVMSINSVCHFFDPDLEDTPTDPYLFIDKDQPENEALNIIRNSKKYNIGIIWAGNDKDYHDCFRSFYLKEYKPLSDIPEIQLFSLQLGKMQRKWLIDINNNKFAQVDLLEDKENINYIDLAPYINDFHDTAQMINTLDLVITIDTSVAHLAGAMGKPVWMLCSTPNHDWRWQKQWYPSMRVFNQSKHGDWSSLFQEVKKELIEVVDTKQH